MITRTLDTCQRSQRLHGHSVSIVNDYADTWDIILPWKKVFKNNKK